jgi:hypothetical protein
LRVALWQRHAKSPPAMNLQLLEGSLAEKRGKGPQVLFNMVGAGKNLDQRFCGTRERAISIPFAHKWLKSRL